MASDDRKAELMARIEREDDLIRETPSPGQFSDVGSALSRSQRPSTSQDASLGNTSEFWRARGHGF